MSDNENNMVNAFITKKKTDEEKMVLQFVQEILKKEVQIKEVKGDIKAIKADAKSNGINVGMINKALTALKASLKQTTLEQEEKDLYMTLIEEDATAKLFLQTLAQKD